MISDTANMHNRGRAASTKKIVSNLRKSCIEGKPLSANGLKPVLADVNNEATDKQAELQSVIAVKKKDCPSGVVRKNSSTRQSSLEHAAYSTIDINKVKADNRMRQADPAIVEELTKSIGEFGLLHPIVLDKNGNLIAGLNRLLACKKLGMTEIPYTRLLSENELHIKLAEIDENLVRANLQQLEEAEQIAIRKEIYEKLYPASTKAAKDKAKIENINKPKAALGTDSVPNDNLSFGAKPDDTFVKDTARKSGMSERTVQRKASLGAILNAVHKKTRDELINLQKIDAGLKFSPEELQVISVATPEKQKEIVDEIKSGKSVAEATGIKKSKRAAATRALDVPCIKKTKYLTAQGYFDPDTFKYYLFRVDYLESGAITITIAAEDTTYFDMWLKNNHAKLHSEPVEIFKD